MPPEGFPWAFAEADVYTTVFVKEFGLINN
jgi:hypothetical protein